MSKKPLDLTVLPVTDYGWTMHMIMFKRAQKNKVLYERHGSHIGSVTESNQSNIKMKSKPNKQLLTVML